MMKLSTGAARPDRMPSLFIGHGSPMNTLERNGFTNTWRKLGEALPRAFPLNLISGAINEAVNFVTPIYV